MAEAAAALAATAAGTISKSSFPGTSRITERYWQRRRDSISYDVMFLSSTISLAAVSADAAIDASVNTAAMMYIAYDHITQGIILLYL